MEIIFQSHADQADAKARNALRLAQLIHHWTHLPPEEWAGLSPEKQGEITDLLKEWNVGEKDVWLALLPREVRRQYE